MEKIVSHSLSFGLQNFLYCGTYVGSDVTGDTYEYVAYQDTKGLILIARFSADGGEGRYITKTGDFDEIIAGRGEYVYLLPNQIKEINSSYIK